tara:strand:- start:4559 stop:4864 length:306 start_codon:yes stop_codon:yes gene_type:complete
MLDFEKIKKELNASTLNLIFNDQELKSHIEYVDGLDLEELLYELSELYSCGFGNWHFGLPKIYYVERKVLTEEILDRFEKLEKAKKEMEVYYNANREVHIG